MNWDLLIPLSALALLLLLIIAYATGEEYPHTHRMIGYGIAALLVASVLWLVLRSRDNGLSGIDYSPRAIRAQIQRANGVPKALLSIVVILAALPFCALLLMLMTHTIWGTSWVDEMHEVIAYFAVGLVVPYCVLVGARSVQLIGLRWRRSFGKSRP